MSLQGENLSPVFSLPHKCEEERRAEHWRIFQMLNHDKCKTKPKKPPHNLRYQYGCDYLPLTFHVFSLHTAQVFLSGSTISMLFLSWLNSAPWNLFCVLQPTGLDQGVKRWQPPGSIIQSFPLPPVRVWTGNVSTFILDILMSRCLWDRPHI